jgi:hypothetical protein
MNPKQKETVPKILKNFLLLPNIANILGTSQPPAPIQTSPPSILKDIKSIKVTLSALQKAISPTTQAGKLTQSKMPDSAPSMPPARAKGKSHPLTFAGVAAAPPCPSVVVGLAHLHWPEKKPSLAELYTNINSALEASGGDQACISTARWTARDKQHGPYRWP